ncbi:MAG: virulence RhuM family protein [Thermoguttaceae bacterium]
MNTDKAPEGQILLFSEGEANINVRVEGETVWLTQAAMAELYQTTPQNITLHIKGIYEEDEQDEATTCKEYLQVQKEGNRPVRRFLKHYSLEMILAVGYRVRSPRGTLFRRWATLRLEELLRKGFTMDDERIKEGRTAGTHYFDELLERIRDIRSSEKLFYQKIMDIYATSIDYDSCSEITKEFFATVQNKLHWAIHGHTAAELIYERVSSQKTNLGLTTWKNGPKGTIRKTDVTIAKNYLTEDELQELNRVVSMYLDYAEDQARRHIPMQMTNWIEALHEFLKFTRRNILTHAGKISHQQMERKAHQEFTEFDKTRLLEADNTPSDFDRFIEETQKREKRLPSPKKRKEKDVEP